MNLEYLIRPNIKSLKPYRSARHEFSTGILLDANENSFGSVLSIDGIPLNRYPDPFQLQLRTRLAEINDVSAENIFVGVGSDEAIDLLIRIFCEPAKDSIMVLEPTYGMYRVAAGINDVAVQTCLLTDEFQIDRRAVQQTVHSQTKMIFCCSPNNPTANLLRREDILELCEQTERIVVVDEAYLDFAEAESLSPSVRSIPNLIVLRTLSKAWGLAGIRLGYAVADPVVISFLMKIKSPYNINVLTSRYGLEALQKVDEMKQAVRTIREERERLAARLTELSSVERVFPSDANFLLIRCRNARAVYRGLAERGIIVRDRSGEPKLSNCLRVTVGTPEENDALIEALKELGV